jgi:hypothetical protein
MSTNTFKSILGFTMLSGIPCIDPASVRVIPGYNVRDAFDPATDPADAQLADNMAANGFIADKPITVRIVTDAAGQSVAYVVAGHRRLDAANWINAQWLAANPVKGKAAAKKAAANRPIRGVTFIPEAVQANGEVRSPVEMSYDLELSNTGKPLSPAERGANILRLRAMGETDETIAKRLGIGTRWVGDLAKLGRSDPRLKALVKAGVIPPTTAILLERAHGAAIGTEVAVKAAAIAKGKGKASATGKDVAEAEAAAGVVAKVGAKNKKGSDQRATEKPTVTVIPEKPAKAGAPIVSLATLAGPFHLGKDLEERSLYDANGLELCEMADVGMARAMLQLTMLGWNVLRGTASQAATEAATAMPAAKPPTKAEAKAAAKAEAAAAKAAAEAEAAAAIAAEAAALDAAEAKAKRQAEARDRVARQVAADDAKRVAAAEANRKAAAAMVAGKPIAAMAKAAAAKVTAAAKAAAAKAAAEALAAAEAAEAEAAALAKAEAATTRKAAAAAAALAKSNGKAKAGRAKVNA